MTKLIQITLLHALQLYVHFGNKHNDYSDHYALWYFCVAFVCTHLPSTAVKPFPLKRWTTLMSAVILVLFPWRLDRQWQMYPGADSEKLKKSPVCLDRGQTHASCLYYIFTSLEREEKKKSSLESPCFKVASTVLFGTNAEPFCPW